MSEDQAVLEPDFSDDTDDLSHYDEDIDDDIDDEYSFPSVRSRTLMEGETVPTIPTMYQQLAMAWRAGERSAREDAQDRPAN